MRLDRAVTARGLARSRSHAQQLIAASAVLVDGVPATKASLVVADHSVISLANPAASRYVSRAALKLLGALDACAPLGLTVEGRRALDAGASTGGFTQVLLERGACNVVALDVGHAQLATRLREDPRVTTIENFNVRDLDATTEGAGVDLAVADLSFISLTLAIGPMLDYAADHADLLLMVKPQFEVGRPGLDKHGVVTDLAARAGAVERVVVHMREAGLDIHAIERSSLPGPAGNVEFFVWGSRPWQAKGAGAERGLRAAPESGTAPVLDDAQIAQAIAREVERQQ